MAFERAKSFVFRYFELVLVITLILGLSFILLVVPQKLGFLNFYYLPVLAAGYAMGKKGGVLTALSAVLIVAFSVVAFPEQYLKPVGTGALALVLNLLPWGGFLILSSYTVGYLYEEKQRQIEIVRDGYVGVLEILSRLMESADRYTQGHSVRVSKLATDIALALGIEREEVENVRVAALLHDIGKFEITTDLIQKAADLTDEERAEINKRSELGLRLISRVGPVLKQAVPIIFAHHEHYIQHNHNGDPSSNDIPLGARIVAVADAYDTMTTDRPYRPSKLPREAVEEIRKAAGNQYDSMVVEAFERVAEKLTA